MTEFASVVKTFLEKSFSHCIVTVFFFFFGASHLECYVFKMVCQIKEYKILKLISQPVHSIPFNSVLYKHPLNKCMSGILACQIILYNTSSWMISRLVTQATHWLVNAFMEIPRPNVPKSFCHQKTYWWNSDFQPELCMSTSNYFRWDKDKKCQHT